jgi:hypothetical protein
LVLRYLVRDPYVFVSSQYSIKDGAGREWSCPDFVALDFRRRLVSIVEVNTAYTRDRLWKKVASTMAVPREVFIRNGAVALFKSKIAERMRGTAPTGE